MLMIRPSNRRTNVGARIRMKPARTTRSGWKTATASATPTFHAARSSKSFVETTTEATPASCARSRAPAAGLSVTTPTTRAPYDASSCAASRAARLEPNPETSTDDPLGRRGLDGVTGGRLHETQPTWTPVQRAEPSADGVVHPSRRAGRAASDPSGSSPSYPSDSSDPQAAIRRTRLPPARGPRTVRGCRA